MRFWREIQNFCHLFELFTFLKSEIGGKFKKVSNINYFTRTPHHFRALTMPVEEREVRMASLRQRERQMDVNHWIKTYLETLKESGTDSIPLIISDFDPILKKYVGDKTNLALLLDYDGTLSPIVKHPDLAILPPETKQVLERLARRPDVFIAVVSGRGVDDVKSKVGIENITYAGNHGLEIHHADGTKYVHPIPDSNITELVKLAINIFSL